MNSTTGLAPRRRVRTSRALFTTVKIAATWIQFLWSLPAFSQWQSVGNLQSVIRESNRMTLNCQNAEIQISALAPAVMRIRMTPGHQFAPDHSWAVIKSDWPRVPVEVREDPGTISLNTPELALTISRSPCRLIFRDKGGVVINEDDPGKGMSWDVNHVRAWKILPQGESYFALGEKAGPLEHSNQVFVNWNSDAFGYQRGSDPIYQSIPFFLAVRRGVGYGIFFDNSFRSTFDFGKMRRDQYSFGADGGELNYYFIYGPSPKKVIELYTELTGRMPLPPRWALGYQQCRYSYEPESRVREIVDNFRRRNIPCDVIYLDIDYMNGYRCFTVDLKKFPHFQQMVADFARVGMKVITIIDPGVKQEPGYWVYDEGLKGNHFVRMPDGELFLGNVWPGRCVFPDFTRASTRDWWGTLYKGLVAAGVKGFWNDMNEPAVFVDAASQMDRTMDPDAVFQNDGIVTSHRQSHNIYGMQMARATFEGIRKLRPAERPFVLTRAAYAGGQRYAATWTGDNSSTWDHLWMSISMTLNLGLSGQPFAGPDIGGFIGNPSPELYARFMEACVFCPFMREHSMKGTRDREPWAYGTQFENINRKSIELRYRMMPYIYTLFEEASRTGMPVMRPLFLEYPTDAKTYGMDTEFLFGSDLLVAPVLTEGATNREVYFPAGDWVDFRTHEKFTGPKEATVQAPLDVLPLFVRAGAILPMQPVRQYTDAAPADPLMLEIFPAADSMGSLYEDDGISYAYQQGQMARTRYHWHQTDREAVLEIERTAGTLRLPDRAYQLSVNGVRAAPQHVMLGGQNLPQVRQLEQIALQKSGWFFDSSKSILWIRFPDTGSSQKVMIR